MTAHPDPSDARPPLLLGLDLGTEGLRAGLTDLEGRLVAAARQPYPTRFPQPQWAEQDPHDWWRAACRAIPDCLEQAHAAPSQVLGIGLDAFASTLVACDREGEPLRDAILWMDVRAVQEAASIERTADPVLRYGGGSESPEWMLPRLLWLKQHEPQVFERAALFVEALDWLTHRLTGRWVLSMCQITDLWHYVPSRGGWPLSLLDAIGLSGVQSKWPEEIRRIGDRVGGLSAGAAQELGLLAGTPVACGGIDAHIALLGLNALRPGQVGLILGSSSVQLTMTQGPVFHTGIWGPFEDTILPGRWLLEAGQVSTGSILRWYEENMLPAGIRARTEQAGIPVLAFLDRMAAELPPGAGGLVALDYWQGNRTPVRDSRARGAIIGLTLWHTPAHVYRSLLEAAAFGHRHILETFQEAGVPVAEVIACGGGARSPVWLQMHADVAGQPLRTTASPDAALLGCAVAASVCVGLKPDLQAAADGMVAYADPYVPDPERHREYSEPYHRYRELYPAVRPLFQRLAAEAGPATEE